MLDDAEVCVVAYVVHDHAGLAHSWPGCSVALATNDREDHKPETGKGTAPKEGMDAITPVIGSEALELPEVVKTSEKDGTLVEATNTYITKLTDEESAAVLVIKMKKAAIAEEYLATGGSGSVAVEAPREKVLIKTTCTGANDWPGELGLVAESTYKHESDVEGTHKKAKVPVKQHSKHKGDRCTEEHDSSPPPETCKHARHRCMTPPTFARPP